MAGGSRSGDVVLGGRHLVGLFALLVVVLGIVFTLGYLLGRSRFEDQARLAAANAASESSPAAGAPARAPAAGTASPGATQPAETPPTTWDFYRSGEPARAPELTPQPAAAPAKAREPSPARAPAAAPRPAPAAPSTPAPANSALIPKGAITLQVAALLREPDALLLAQELQEKKFPAIVTTPSTDKYYRVQVGPYPDLKAATAARRELEKQGFKPIVRR